MSPASFKPEHAPITCQRMDHFVAHDLWRNEAAIFEDAIHFGELVVRDVSRLFVESKDSEEFFSIYTAFNSPHFPVQPPIYPHGGRSGFLRLKVRAIGR